jgi:citrate lyase beta subunit
VHTVYGGAHLFASDSAKKLGALAVKTMQEYAVDAEQLATAFDLPPALAARIHPRVADKLTREPIEDFRIDFEDGFGNRPDDDEDRYARSAAEEVAAGMAAHTLPAGIGIRIKNLGAELERRSLRTFDLFLTSLLDRTGGVLPENFVVTLPKITAPAQVTAMASACDAFERSRGLSTDTLKFEVMVETTQSIFAADGTVALPRLVAEGRGRIVAAHFGTYDYTAACGITAAHQHMMHPA